MKMAAAEALWETAGGPGNPPAEFSIFTIGTLDGSEEVFAIKIPYLLGLLSHNDPFAKVQGINELNEAYRSGAPLVEGNVLMEEYADRLATLGIDNFAPNIPVAYWTFRLMILTAMIGMAIGAYVLWVLRKGGLPKRSLVWTTLLWLAPLAPLFGNSFGWIFTEMGRQPWIVAGVLPTASAVSPGVTQLEVWISMVGYTILYGALAVVELKLMARYALAGLPDVAPVEVKGEDEVLSFAY
jgi:cytochrome d ubiquinol oxidase subunit I